MSNHTVKSPSGSRRGRPALAALAVAVLGGVGLAGPASAGTVRQSDPVQTSLDKAVRSGELPGALASVRDANGQVRNYTAGVGDLKTKAEVPVDGQVRIASNTKMFTAVVVLQLAAEGKIKLDAPVEKYLPKVIRGKGNDGRKITTRQLLQHTSGLHSYTANMPSIFKIQHTYSEPHALLDTGAGAQAGLRPRQGLGVQQHRLCSARPARTEGDRAADRRGDHRADHQAGRPAGAPTGPASASRASAGRTPAGTPPRSPESRPPSPWRTSPGWTRPGAGPPASSSAPPATSTGSWSR